MLRCFSCVQLSATPWTLCNPMELTRLLCPWDSPGKNTGVGCHFLLQQIFPIQRSNLHLLHWKRDSLPLSHQDLQILLIVIIIFLRYELGTHMHRNPPSTVLSRYKIFSAARFWGQTRGLPCKIPSLPPPPGSTIARDPGAGRAANRERAGRKGQWDPPRPELRLSGCRIAST